MAVDHRLDLLGMNLESADIDDAIRAADKVVAVAAALDQIARIDEIVWVFERRTVEIGARRAAGANAQRPLLDLHIHGSAGFLEKPDRKSGKAIADLEGHSGLGRSEGMPDIRIGIGRTQRVQYALIGDLSG